MNCISMDFETRSETDLDLGAWTYSKCSTTQALCLCWKYNNDEKNQLWIPGKLNEDLSLLFERINSGKWRIYAWNAYFEYCVWNNCCTRLYGFPKVPKERFFCTQAMALTLGLPDQLEKAGRALHMKTMKDKKGKALINKLSKKQTITKKCPTGWWTPETAPEFFDEMYDYCSKDVDAEHAIHKRLKDYELDDYERDLYLATVRMNEQGVPVDIDTAETLRMLLEKYEQTLLTEFREITKDTISTTGQLAKIREWLLQRGIGTSNLNKATVADLLARDDIPQDVRRLLEIRKILSRSSTDKIKKLCLMADDQNHVHDILRYHKATTGRWGGSGIQIHNLPRSQHKYPEVTISIIESRNLKRVMLYYDDLFDMAVRLIRSLVLARPGHLFYVSDFSAIEHRVLSWLVRDESTLEKYWSGKSIYRWFATLLYPGVQYNDVTSAQRQHAKQCILGLGYGMGWERFKATCEQHEMTMPESEARRSVDLFRETFPLVKSYWYSLIECAMRVVERRYEEDFDRLFFYYDDDFLFCKLPSGREIAYPYAHIGTVTTPWGEKRKGIQYWGEESQTKKWIKLDMNHSKLVENICQAIARDIMGDAKLKLIDAGYNVIFSVHDEIVSHDPIDHGSMAEYDSILCDTDKRIYPGLPISAKGYHEKRYRKD